MQFFHLVPFVVVASYAAALPQPAGLSDKYSNNVDTNLASGLETRSYQPAFNSQKGSATLVSLKRRDDSEDDSEFDDSDDDFDDDFDDDDEDDDFDDDFGDNYEDDYDEDYDEDSELENIKFEFESPLDEVEYFSRLISFLTERSEDDHFNVPENVKTAGAAVSGDTGDLLVKYLETALYLSGHLKTWAEESGKGLDIFIRSVLGDEEYSKVEPSLKEAKEKLIANADDNRKEVADALLVIGEKTGSDKQEMETIHASFGRVFDACRVYLGVLNPQLDKFKAGKLIHGHLSDADKNLVEFSQNQQKLYDEITQGLKDTPSE
ncbi:hypothetical protein BASA50_005759 [Batrachochytrium salamandrivorans]|uniref:Uncharacterized protein n=1 Tax=Batrachochytrium salamandrivorans TaxID=1357716 RepID=A0ABQ8FF11_9FUNG|nr:hypothetical protein BASA50_005759 [Batrachochytrium salamandrivorans]